MYVAGSSTCARWPAAGSGLDAGLEAYHNPAAVWWGLAVSVVVRDQAAICASSAKARASILAHSWVISALMNPVVLHVRDLFLLDWV